MTDVLDAMKVALAVFAAALLQVTIFNDVEVGAGAPDLLLVTVAAVAYLRGAVYGACAGFLGGLVLDTATLETLGVTSLLLTVVGYWIGRYGETTGRDRAHPPLASVALVTVVYAAAAYALRFMLGEEVSARLVLIDALPPELVLNLLLAAPVYALSRRLLRRAAVTPGRQVRLLG